MKTLADFKTGIDNQKIGPALPPGIKQRLLNLQFATKDFASTVVDLAVAPDYLPSFYKNIFLSYLDAVDSIMAEPINLDPPKKDLIKMGQEELGRDKITVKAVKKKA